MRDRRPAATARFPSGTCRVSTRSTTRRARTTRSPPAWTPLSPSQGAYPATTLDVAHRFERNPATAASIGLPLAIRVELPEATERPVRARDVVSIATGLVRRHRANLGAHDEEAFGRPRDIGGSRHLARLRQR